MAKYATHDVDTSKFEGLDFPEPGSYHFILDHYVEENERGSFEAHLSILSGTPTGQEGKSHREYFSLKPKAVPRLIQFAVALGLTTAEAIEAAQAQGDDVEIDWDLAVREGRQCCGVLAHGKNQDGEKKEFVELGFRFFPCDDKRAKSIPLNRQALDDLAKRLTGKAPLKEAKDGDGGGSGGKTDEEPPFDASELFE
jgi:hypothetical protein